MIRAACIALLASAAPALGAVDAGPPPYTGPTILRFFIPTVVVDGVPVIRMEWRCWTGTRWVPLKTDECSEAIFGRHRLEPIPKHQDRLE